MNDSQYKYAGFGRRFLAVLLDGIVLYVISLLFDMVFHTNIVSHSAGTVGMHFSGLNTLIPVLYYVLSWAYLDGATIGKKIMKIKIIKADGSKLDVVSAFVRYLSYIVSSIPLGLGFFWVIWDSKKQGWHDKIAKTYVIHA